MLFNSLEFALFLPIVFILYWFVLQKKTKNQNILLVLASYFFYGWWDWRFLSLILISSFIDFYIGKQLNNIIDKSKRKLLLTLSIVINIGFLGFFKYYNFFTDSFVEAFSFFGTSFSADRLQIILPVGISFYTFQTLSYSIDVYRNKLKPTNDIVSFLAFVSFFPQLVAGPIERATHLLPQFYKKREFSYEYAKSGVQLIVWGLFKKMVIADNAAIIVDGVFSNYETQSGFSLIFGAFLFAFQIYGDFSGYSDIAIGTSRLFGFDLMANFKFPYLSKNIGEFWKRWHISLSSWFRDYVYFPLGGSKKTLVLAIRNVFIVFLISGFWHGANWTFIFWGLIHAVLYIPLFISNKTGLKSRLKPNIFVNILKMLFTFLIVTFAWVFFRADTITDAFIYLKRIFLNESGSSFFLSTSKYKVITLFSILSILFLTVVEFQNQNKSKFEVHLNKYKLVILCLVIAFFGALKNHANFIYFQF